MNSCLNCGKSVAKKYCNTSCQNVHQNSARANKKYGELKMHLVECNKCKKIFQIEERDKLFPQKEVYYCSRACANTRKHTNESKKQISKTLSGNYAGKREIDKLKTCKECKNIYKSRIKSSQFCSVKCASSFHIKNHEIFTKDFQRKAGLASVKAQAESRRSKNEIYFAQLCNKQFNLVKCNEPMFNGWDADVIIEDLKLAVLWNGKWHYSKIKEKHSVEQVQNRDQIKLKEIEKSGYKSYVIKDMGKHNKKFVENIFEEMLCFLKL